MNSRPGVGVAHEMTENTEFDSPALRVLPEAQQSELKSPIRTTKVQNYRLQNKQKKGKGQQAGEEKNDTKKSGKRSDEEVRKERLAQHALLLRVTPHVPRTFTREQKTEEDAYNALLLKWRSIERFGFQVSRDSPGCWVPHRQYLQNSGGRQQLAPHVAAALWKGTVREETTQTTDVDGWPISPQFSHLCHLAMCCNPAHIALEPQWMNSRRNYCGKHGRCDCGMQPPCLAKFYPSNIERDLNLLSYTSARLGERVRDTCPIVNIAIEPASKYDVQDKKRNNRLQRKRKSDKHAAQREQNEQRKGKRKIDDVVPT